MKVLLVFPGYLYDSVATFEEPLGVLYLASALLKAGHDVEVLDLTFDQNDDRLKEKARWADIAGISSTTPLFGSASSLLEHIKRINPGITCVIGGPHATAFPSDALRPGFDAAVIGEGEVTLVELVETLGNYGSLEEVAGIAYMAGDELRMTSPRSFIPSLDDIDMPARQFID